jgi:hypothetical protein
VRARTHGLTADEVDRSLGERSLVVTWLNRGTLHLVRAEDLPWLHALTTPQLATGNARRLAQEGVSPAAAKRGVRTVVRALGDGPAPRAVLREHLETADVPTAGQALAHVLLLAALRGLILRGPVDHGLEQSWVLWEDWLGPRPTVERASALRELGRRYLAGHGPADDRDLAKWAGITLRDARAALRAVEPPRDAGSTVLPLPPPLLLGAFDPVLLGWADRTPVVGEHTGLVTDNGLFRPFALVDGRAAGIWSLRRGRVELTPFAPLSDDVAGALARDAADVERFLG